MKTNLLRCGVVLIVAAISFTACDDDEKPKTVPVVTTAAVKDVATTTAVGGGQITDDGNSPVTASGLVFSTTTTTPTLADNKTEEAVASGTFTSNLEGLASGTIYHVRAYATNAIGTGYGEVVDFTTANSAPTATGISITGPVHVSGDLSATYTYSDAEGDAESGSTFQWYIANDGAGSGETAIANATTLSYTIKAPDEFKYIRIGIIPKSTAGTTTGVEVKSAFVGPVAAVPVETVTFTYNGQSVTYGVIYRPQTGRKWLDRNLGAPNAPTAYNDFANYGDSFQWGRGADGHQRISRGASNGATSGLSGFTFTLATTDVPSDSKFIGSQASPYDWRNPQNSSLWQGVNGVNNPCPSGWRIPTKSEWEAENLSGSLSDAFTQLKITGGGFQDTYSDFYMTTSAGQYWTSTTIVGPTSNGLANFVEFSTTGASSPIIDVGARGEGRMCRCIKN